MMSADELDGLVGQLRLRGYRAITIIGMAGERDPDVTIADVLHALERHIDRTGATPDDLDLFARILALCGPGPLGETYAESLARMAAAGDPEAQRLIDEAAAEELHAKVRHDFEDRVRRGEVERLWVSGQVTFRLRRART